MRAPHVSSRCRPSVESIESAHESSPINNAVEAAISFDVMSMMLIAIEMVSFKCRDACVASRIRFTSDELFANVRTIRVGIDWISRTGVIMDPSFLVGLCSNG